MASSWYSQAQAAGDPARVDEAERMARRIVRRVALCPRGTPWRARWGRDMDARIRRYRRGLLTPFQRESMPLQEMTQWTWFSPMAWFNGREEGEGPRKIHVPDEGRVSYSGQPPSQQTKPLAVGGLVPIRGTWQNNSEDWRENVYRRTSLPPDVATMPYRGTKPEAASEALPPPEHTVRDLSIRDRQGDRPQATHEQAVQMPQHDRHDVECSSAASDRPTLPGAPIWPRFHVPHRLQVSGLGWLEDVSRRVNIHTGHRADRLARIHGAEAVTIGHEVFFRSGRFDPATPRGIALLTHELVHVHQTEGDGASRAVIDGSMEQERRERVALETERMAYRMLDARLLVAGEPPATPMVLATAMLPAAAGRASAAHAPSSPSSLVRGGSPSSATPAAGPMRAVEGRGMDGTSPMASASPDPAELTAQVYRMLERRLRHDRERLGLWRHAE